MDAQGCNIRVDTRGREVMRVLPRLNEEINEEWISDKARHACDGLSRQRLDRPYVRKNGKLKPASWAEAFAAIAAQGARHHARAQMAAIVGDLAAAEEIKALKDLMTALGVPISIAARTAPRFVRSAPDLSVQHHHRRRRSRRCAASDRRQSALGSAGAECAHPQDLAGGTAEGRQYRSGRRSHLSGRATGHGHCRAGRDRQRQPCLRESSEGRQAADAHSGLGRADAPRRRRHSQPGGAHRRRHRHDRPGRQRRRKAAGTDSTCCTRPPSRVAALDLGFLPGAGGRDVAGIVDGAQKGEIDFIYLLGADEFDVDNLGRAFVVYQGSHGDAGAHHADVILPGAAYTEKDGTLRQFRRPGAARRARHLPAGRGEGGLGDPARAVRASGRQACPTTIARRFGPRS